MLENASWKSFEQQLHTTFYLIAPGNNAVALELFEMTQLMDPKLAPRMEQFSLLFRGPGAPYFPQGIYTLEHDTLGSGQLFIVPIGPDNQGMRYEVVFSRALKVPS